MKNTYVAIATFGSYEDKDYAIIYAGQFEEEAERACKNFVFPNEDNNYAGYEIWEDGKQIGYKQVID